MLKKFTFYLLFLFLTAGCSLYNIDSEDISTDYYSPKNSSNEVIYVENVTRPHEIIGYVTVNAERKQRSTEDVLDKIKYEAAILGGDAITDIRTDAPGYWKKLPAQELVKNAYVRANYTATVIVFK